MNHTQATRHEAIAVGPTQELVESMKDEIEQYVKESPPRKLKCA